MHSLRLDYVSGPISLIFSEHGYSRTRNLSILSADGIWRNSLKAVEG